MEAFSLSFSLDKKVECSMSLTTTPLFLPLPSSFSLSFSLFSLTSPVLSSFQFTGQWSSFNRSLFFLSATYHFSGSCSCKFQGPKFQSNFLTIHFTSEWKEEAGPELFPSLRELSSLSLRLKSTGSERRVRSLHLLNSVPDFFSSSFSSLLKLYICQRGTWINKHLPFMPFKEYNSF